MPSTTTLSMSSSPPQVLLRKGRSVTSSKLDQQQILRLAAERLEHHAHFRGRSRFVQLRLVGNRLILGGCLPSYYLKQLAQEAIREIKGVKIDNRIVVTGMIGDFFPPKPKNKSTNSIKRIPR